MRTPTEPGMCKSCAQSTAPSEPARIALRDTVPQRHAQDATPATPTPSPGPLAHPIRTLSLWFRPTAGATAPQVPPVARVSGYPPSAMTPRSPIMHRSTSRNRRLLVNPKRSLPRCAVARMAPENARPNGQLAGRRRKGADHTACRRRRHGQGGERSDGPQVGVGGGAAVGVEGGAAVADPAESVRGGDTEGRGHVRHPSLGLASRSDRPGRGQTRAAAAGVRPRQH